MKPKLIEVTTLPKKGIHIKEVDQEYLSFPLHFHDFCELVLITESYGKRIVGDHVGSFNEGDLVLMGPNLPHIWNNDAVFQQQATALRAKAIVIYFPTDFLLELTDDDLTILTLQQLIRKAKRGLRFSGTSKDLLSDKIKTIIHKEGIAKIIDFLSIIDLMVHSEEVECLASETYQPVLNEQHVKRINEVYLYVMNHFQREIPLAEVAAIAHITPNAFCRFFKKHTQKSFSRFVNELRIGHACKLLLNKELSISQICYQSGYQNLTNFNKFFRLIMNKSAGQYRKDVDLQS